MKQPLIVIQGSLNYDMFAKASRLPQKGESILGHTYNVFSGGKGANQAVQMAKLGAEVYMIGKIGNDYQGDFILQKLQDAGVICDYLQRGDYGTGISCVHCADDGIYNSIVVPNGNACCNAEDVLRAEERIKNADVCVCQLETTDEAVDCLMELAERYQVPVVLNPAPAKQVDESIFRRAYIVTPNEAEAALYAEMPIEEVASEEGRKKAAKILLEKGAQRALITLGAHGCYYYDGKEELYCPSYSVRAVDSSAAGDSFNGALSYSIAMGYPMEKVLSFANAAGALTASKLGAQESMSDYAAVAQMAGF